MYLSKKNNGIKKKTGPSEQPVRSKWQEVYSEKRSLNEKQQIDVTTCKEKKTG